MGTNSTQTECVTIQNNFETVRVIIGDDVEYVLAYYSNKPDYNLAVLFSLKYGCQKSSSTLVGQNSTSTLHFRTENRTNLSLAILTPRMIYFVGYVQSLNVKITETGDVQFMDHPTIISPPVKPMLPPRPTKRITITEYKIASLLPSNNGKGAPFVRVLPDDITPKYIPAELVRKRLEKIPLEQQLKTNCDIMLVDIERSDESRLDSIEYVVTEYMRQGWSNIVKHFAVPEWIFVCDNQDCHMNNTIECFGSYKSSCKRQLKEIQRMYAILSREREIEIEC